MHQWEAVTRIPDGLKRLCRNRCRAPRGSRFFPPDPGLAPLATCKAAASRLVYRRSNHFVPTANFVGGCEPARQVKNKERSGKAEQAAERARKADPSATGAASG
jgi:hypothetical protein